MGCTTSLPADHVNSDQSSKGPTANATHRQRSTPPSELTVVVESPAQRRHRLRSERPPPDGNATSLRSQDQTPSGSRRQGLKRLPPTATASSAPEEDRPFPHARQRRRREHNMAASDNSNTSRHEAAGDRSHDLASWESSAASNAAQLPRLAAPPRHQQPLARSTESAAPSRGLPLQSPDPLMHSAPCPGSASLTSYSRTSSSWARTRPRRAEGAGIDIRQSASGRSFMLASAGAFGQGSNNPCDDADRQHHVNAEELLL